ncbi:MAG: hypothetical protein ACE5EK_04200, partial [Nitrospinales bacterium]
MNVMIDFFRTLLLMKKPWVIWVGMLLAANMVAPLFFIETIEAQAVLAAAMAGAMIQMVIFGNQGFVRLLGIGHVFWIPLVLWLLTRLDTDTLETPFGMWLGAVMVLNSLSLLI